MAFSIYGSSPYNRYMPAYGSQAAIGANPGFGNTMPALSPGTASFTQAAAPLASSQAFGATGYSNVGYAPIGNPYGTPNNTGFPSQNRFPAAPNRLLNPPGFLPYQQPIIYANAAALSQQEQRKKYWSKFMLNTGSTLAGLSLAAYFGMKILPKAIVSEMGIQVKNNLLSKTRKDVLLKKKGQELLRSSDTPKWIKDLIGKDPKTLTKWQKSKLEKILLEKAETSEVFSEFMKDSCTQTMADKKFQESTANFMHATFDDKFQTEFSGKMIDSIQKAAEEKNILGWLYKEAQQTLKNNGSWLSRFF